MIGPFSARNIVSIKHDEVASRKIPRSSTLNLHSAKKYETMIRVSTCLWMDDGSVDGLMTLAQHMLSEPPQYLRAPGRLHVHRQTGPACSAVFAIKRNARVREYISISEHWIAALAYENAI